jgi:hypothetical protein
VRRREKRVEIYSYKQKIGGIVVLNKDKFWTNLDKQGQELYGGGSELEDGPFSKHVQRNIFSIEITKIEEKIHFS